ncbi:diguanylate cyclase (GGDEF)-like protein/PAS domain S-box-containing protein [Evansella vedderi]|uniref:Diguanylate cyclase (GGDEF)-like protein/PAS domain S-box-containing protein n=1 Tax=Evansella vedderi TaxID=38282 RepID=A0ABT9ZP92_9BACI|nr:sensor domain-containing diguanylate cyclase [Evansella vedderi]MDQ0253056.1 diguanylate cyclase (GGDEF)-like protein/PAS domain S-box-containing protein [Evansella vedderi]
MFIVGVLPFATIPFESIISLVFLLAMGYFLWKLWKSMEWIEASLIEARQKNDEMEKELSISNKNNTEYKKLLNSLNGAIYSFDYVTNKFYFSTGFEDIYGYNVDLFNKNPLLWNEVIHVDHLTKLEKDERQILNGKTTMTEFQIQHPQLGERWVAKYTKPIMDVDGNVTKVNGQIVDITVRKEMENELKLMAYNDKLTDLPNRVALDRHMKKALARSKRHNHNLSIMFIDLDDFKVVNDTLGHDAGDELLKGVVSRINESIREEDLVARIGGDEFIIVFEETDRDEIEEIAKRMIENVAYPYMIDETKTNISLSIGISMYPDDGCDKDTLLEHADKAMYYAKSEGKNNYKIYFPDLNEMDFGNVGILERIMNKIQVSKLFS